MYKYLLSIFFLLPLSLLAQTNTGLKFSLSALNVTVETGKMVNFRSIKVLSANNTPSYGTSVEYKFTPATVISSIPGFPPTMLQQTGPDGSLPGFVTNMAPGSFVLTLTIPGTQTTATVNVKVTPVTSVPMQYRIERVSAVSQTAFINSEFLENCKVRVFSNNIPAAGVPVLFTIGGSFASGEFPNLAGGGPKFTNTVTDQDGYATALFIKANAIVGTFYVTAASLNQTVKFSLTNAQANQ